VKKHILIIPSFYHTEDDPNVGMFFKEQSEALLSYNFKVGLLYPERRSLRKFSLGLLRKFHFQLRNYNEKGLNVYRMHSWNLIPTKWYLGNLSWVKYCLILFEKYIKENGLPDLIHAHCSLWAGYTAYIIKQKYNIPYIITEHSSLFLKGNYSSLEEKKAKIAFNGADKIIAVSNSFAKTLTNTVIPNKNIEVVPNFIDTDFFKNQNNKKKDDFVFMTACFLKRNKRVDRLIHAFAMHFKNKPNVKLYIIGDGEEKKNLKDLVGKLGVVSQVTFLGGVNREQLRYHLSLANCFVLPSDMETFGVVLIEAMSMGLPLIATKCGGPEDIISEGIGLLCEKNEVSLSNAMQEIYYNYDQFSKEYIRNYCINTFSNKSVLQKLLSLYSEVSKGNLSN
jgi:L-malate glycosyltransferase